MTMMISAFLCCIGVLFLLGYFGKERTLPAVFIGLMALGTNLFMEGLSYLSTVDPATGIYTFTAISTILTQVFGRLLFWGAFMTLISRVFDTQDRSE
jgi:hypothetical protein